MQVHVMLAMTALVLAGSFVAALSPSVVVVDLRMADQPTVVAAQTCIGLLNRNEHNDTVAGPMYSIMSSGVHDLRWLSVLNLTQSPHIPIPSLIQRCLVESGQAVATGYIRYHYATQQKYVPLILTLAAVLNAVPLEDSNVFNVSGKAPLVLDAIAFFASLPTLAAATRRVFDLYGNMTTTTAMMNPGFNNNGGWNDGDPSLTGQPDLGLADYVVKARLFNFYLVNGCINGTKDAATMQHMVAASQSLGFWPKLIPNFGYNDAWAIFGGDIFEAMTNCVPQRNMGECASSGFNNLAYLSRASPIVKPLPHNPEPRITFNASKTYVAFVMGDGDNTQYLKTGRMDMMIDRQLRCAANASLCFPLLWSFSSWMLTLGPQIVHWYYGEAMRSGKDYFTFPPSGYLYSYPSMFPADVQREAVRGLEERAEIMNAFTTVSWEPFDQWGQALSQFYPQYADKGMITGVFAVNVPFLIPVLEFGLHFYLVLNSTTGSGNSVIVFRPREWRGSNASLSPPFGQPEYLTPSQMAHEISTYPRGTVSHLYCTTDGGFTLSMLFEMVPQLEDHVEVVSANQLVDLAKQRSSLHLST